MKYFFKKYRIFRTFTRRLNYINYIKNYTQSFDDLEGTSRIIFF